MVSPNTQFEKPTAVQRIASMIRWISAGLAILSAALAVWLGFGIPAILIGLFAVAVWLAGRACFVVLVDR
jgi:hypothetical protein